MSTDNQEEKQRNYLAESISGIIMILIVKHFWPAFIPFEIGQFWHRTGNLATWLKAGWPLLAWGLALSLTVAAATRKSWSSKLYAERHLTAEIAVSIWAGVMEEICFRWILFLSAIVAFKFSNFILGGFAFGIGLPGWLQIHVVGPIINLLTLGLVHNLVDNPSSWAVCGALLSTNAFFRDGHKYQGPIGVINSWYAGLFFFYILFAYGLAACILLHLLYDVIVTIVHYGDAITERAADRRRIGTVGKS